MSGGGLALTRSYSERWQVARIGLCGRGTLKIKNCPLAACLRPLTNSACHRLGFSPLHQSRRLLVLIHINLLFNRTSIYTNQNHPPHSSSTLVSSSTYAQNTQTPKTLPKSLSLQLTIRLAAISFHSQSNHL